MKVLSVLTMTLVGLGITSPGEAQVAGTTLLGVSVAELRSVALGWSVKHQILARPVYNEKGERVGSIDDIIIAGDKAVSYAIVNAGGYLAVTRHDVAIPVSQLKLVNDKFILPGATKEALKASPVFEYTH